MGTVWKIRTGLVGWLAVCSKEIWIWMDICRLLMGVGCGSGWVESGQVRSEPWKKGGLVLIGMGKVDEKGSEGRLTFIGPLGFWL